MKAFSPSVLSLGVRPRVRPISAVGLLILLTGGQGAHAETLADAVALAYAHNPTLVQQRFRQNAQDENYVQARAQYGPTLNVQATGSYTDAFQGSFRQSNNNGQVVGTISQPLYTGGRLRGQLLAARAGVSAGQQTLRQVEQQVIENVVIVYASVLRDQQRVEVGRENVAVLQDQLRENRARYSVVGAGKGAGDVTLTDVGQADSRLAGAETELATLEANFSISRGQYLQIVGQNPGTLEALPDIPRMPSSIDEAFALAEANNPGLLTAKYEEQASSANAASVRGALGPTISTTIQGVYQNKLFPFSGQLGTKELAAGVTITQPIFSSGALRSQVRQADAQNSADQAAVDIERRTTIQSVVSAWSQLSATRLSLVAGERQVNSAQLAFAGMHREELNGLRTTIDTLNAEQELVSAQLALLENRYEEYTARAALLVATGALSPDVFARDIDRYDPEDNFRKVRNKGATPIEPIAKLLDRIGSANPRRPLSADLTGADSPLPDAAAVVLPVPSSDLTRKPLVPVTQSRLVPASELPGGLPQTGDLPVQAAIPPDPGP